MAPGGDGIDHFHLTVVLDAPDQIAAEAVGGIHPLCSQCVGHADHGVKLILGNGDIVVQQQAVHRLLIAGQILPQQDVPLLLRDPHRVIRRVTLAAVANVPVTIVIGIGHAPEALEGLDHGHTGGTGGIGIYRQGGGRQQRQHKQHAKAQGQDLLHGLHGYSHFLSDLLTGFDSICQKFTIIPPIREEDCEKFNIF